MVLRSNEVPDEEVQREMEQLHQAFEAIRMELYCHILETKPNLDEFAAFISCPGPSWKSKRPKRMTEIDLDRIMQPDAQFRQMFVVINQYTNWYNYELLNDVAQRFGNPELKEKMASYRLMLSEFESHTSAEKLKGIELAQPLADSVSIIARLPRHNCNQFTGGDVRKLKRQYTDDAGLNSAAVRTHSVNQSSVEIIFLVPISLAPHLVVTSFAVSPLLTTQDPLPEDMHERCVHYMHEEEVFRLMGVSLIFIGVYTYTSNDRHSHMDERKSLVYSIDYWYMSL